MSDSEKSSLSDRTRRALREWNAIDIGGDRTVQEIRTRILLLGLHLSRDNDRIARKLGVSGEEMRVLYSLRRITPHVMRPTDLKDALLIQSSSLTGKLDRLEALGLITRERDDKDRRGLLVKLTEQGVKLADASLHEALTNSSLSKALLSMSADKRKKAAELLEEILNSLE